MDKNVKQYNIVGKYFWIGPKVYSVFFIWWDLEDLVLINFMKKNKGIIIQ